jgi:ribokinase
MIQNPGIVVVGSTNIDMICQTDHLPAIGETVVGGTFAQAFGGKGANQAVAAARAGGNVAFITAVGNDAYAQQVTDSFARDGIDVRHVLRKPNTSTGVALIMLDRQGRNYLSIASGANQAISAADIDAAADTIRSASIIVMQNEIATAAALRTISIAQAARVPVLFNYAPVTQAQIPTNGSMTYLVINENEAAQLSSLPVQDESQAAAAARKLKAQGSQVVIITLGAAGSFVLCDQGQWHTPPFKVDPVDTTAAGDTYCGALAVALLEKLPLKEAVIFATAASAISVTRMGAQPSIPSRAEIDAFLKARR